VWDEASGQLHRELESLGDPGVAALATFPSTDGQQIRLVAACNRGLLHLYDPESDMPLLRSLWINSFQGLYLTGLACIASSSPAPHHARVISADSTGTAKVWEGDSLMPLAELKGRSNQHTTVAVWKEHTGQHDRIATAYDALEVKIWNGETFTMMHNLRLDSRARHVLPYPSPEGDFRFMVLPPPTYSLSGLQVGDPQEGCVLLDGINKDCPLDQSHLFVSSEGRHTLALVGSGVRHARHPSDMDRPFIDVWDLGAVPAVTEHVRPAHHLG
jgi:WD40 repeat protein